MRQKTFILADTHFSNDNIIQSEKRPFEDTKEMDVYVNYPRLKSGASLPHR